jgi:hypothetical protein
MSRETEYVEFKHCDIIADTKKAILVRCDDFDPDDTGYDEVWIPRSVVEDGEQFMKQDEDVTVSIAEWFCEQEGLVDYETD